MESLRVLLSRHLKSSWKYRWYALALSWLVCVAGWAGVYLIPNQYESSARVYVDTDAVLTPLLKGLAVDTAPNGQFDLLQRTLLSRPNLEAVISKTDLDLQVTSQTDRELMAQALAKDIKINPQTRTIFTITYRNADPQLAYSVVQTLLSIFVERISGVNRSDMQAARRFLDHQIASYEQQLRNAERRRADFRTKYLDVLNEKDGPNRLDMARGAVVSLSGQLQDANMRRDALKKELSSTPPMVVTEGGAGGGSALERAQQQLAELRTRYTESHPDVIIAKNMIASLRATGGGGGGGGSKSAPNPLYEQLKTRLLDSDAQVASLQRQLNDANQERERQEQAARLNPTLQAEYQALDRDYSILQDSYEKLLSRRESANISQAADTQADKVKLQIVDPPQLPRVPAAPNRILLVSGVLVAGLGAGVGLSILLAQMDRSFHRIEDLRALGLTVIGGISMIRPPRSRRHVMGAVTFCAGILLLCVAYGGLLSRLLRVTVPI